MFGFDKPEDGSHERFHKRIQTFEVQAKPVIKHHMWWMVHNCVAHPLIGVIPIKLTFEFHDYTSRKISGE